MAVRTYIPLLLHLLHQVCKYITKHRTRLVEVIGQSNASKLDDIIAACDAFTTIAEPFLGTPV